MQIEQMETVLGKFVTSYSLKVGSPLHQHFSLVSGGSEIRVGQEIIEVGFDLILEGVNLSELVDKMIHLNWLLFQKAKEEKRRQIETEMALASAHLEELARFCTIEEFNNFLNDWKRHPLVLKGE